MEDVQKLRTRLGKNYAGELLRLRLVKIEDTVCENLYAVCRVILHEGEEDELIPLYRETFTPAQIEAFYNPKHYARYMDEEDI